MRLCVFKTYKGCKFLRHPGGVILSCLNFRDTQGGGVYCVSEFSKHTGDLSSVKTPEGVIFSCQLSRLSVSAGALSFSGIRPSLKILKFVISLPFHILRGYKLKTPLFWANTSLKPVYMKSVRLATKVVNEY